MKRCLIDADSLIYIIAWNHKESSEVDVKEACDTFLRDILLMSGCDEYIGSFSASKTFRNDIYKVAQYKGNRPEKPDFVKQWETVIKTHYMLKHGFVLPGNCEADDVVIAQAYFCQCNNIDYVIASPDKDLKQFPGTFYNYSKQGEELPVLTTVTKEEAYRNFWTQVLTGDGTDNILGVPGLGPVKVMKAFDTAIDTIQYPSIAKEAFYKYYGEYYGRIIFEETVSTCKLLVPEHKYWHLASEFMGEVFTKCVRILRTGATIFDV